MNKILSTMLVIGIIFTGTVTESMTSESPNTVSQDTTIVHNTTPLCVTRWPTWINHHNPNKTFGDYASFTPEQLQKLCPGGTIEQIECETTDGIPHSSIGPAHRCQSKKEMVCNSADTLPVECRNYTIRYYCLLGASTPVSTLSMNSALTPTPSPSTQPTVYNESARTSATPNADNFNLCVPGWSNYINENHPSASNHGDKEMSEREYKMFNHSFCRHGSVTKAECWDLEIDAPHYSSGAVMTCTPEQGLVCNDADNFPIRCDDYKIRYLCDCEPSSIVSPTTGTIQATGSLTPARTIPTPMTTAKPSPGSFPAQTTPAPGTSAVTCTNGWSAWINKDTPDTGDGDHEAMTAMEKKAFCQGGTIMDIQCATVGGVAYDQTGEIATCYTDTGFTCNNLDNDFLGQPCSDYQIRYRCKCAEPITTPSPSPGKFITPSASPTSGGQGTPTPAPTSVGQGSPTPAPTSVGQGSPTPAPTSVGQGSPTAEPTTVGQNSRTAAPPVCVTRWSTWINRNNPENHDGDYESLTPEELKKFCPGGSIKKVECQTTDGIPDYSTGAIQQCTPEKGLVCNNDDNFPVGCDNYEIRYYCLCGTNPTAAPTTAGQNTQSLSPTVVAVTPTNLIPADCKTALGMENEVIRREMITASSQRSEITGAEYARLNGPTAWVAGIENKDQYIQVNFLQPTYITGVTTQGRPTVPSYVSSYFVMFSSDGVNWNTYTENGQKKQFNGNFDSLTPVTHFFTSPIRAQFIRINPQTFYSKMAMRFEVHGCFVPYPMAPTPEGTTDTPAVVTTEAPRPCENKTFWSPWVDKHKPDTIGGESEFMTVQEIQAFCPYGTISNIECTQQDGTDFTATGEIATCNIAGGFVCDGAVNAPFPCNDYRVRYQCKEVCLVTTVPTTTASPTSKTTEAPPTTVSSTTATPTPGTTEAPPQLCTTSHWGSWINRDKPDIGGGDHEFLTTHELERFCYGGQLSKIECAVDSKNIIPYYSSGEVVGYCDKERGFICNNADNFPVQCSDYKIRYFCNCTNPTEPSELPMSPIPTTEAATGSATTLGTMWKSLGIGIAVGVPFTSCMICCIILICKKKSRSRKISNETENHATAKY